MQGRPWATPSRVSTVVPIPASTTSSGDRRCSFEAVIRRHFITGSQRPARLRGTLWPGGEHMWVEVAAIPGCRTRAGRRRPARARAGPSSTSATRATSCRSWGLDVHVELIPGRLGRRGTIRQLATALRDAAVSSRSTITLVIGRFATGEAATMQVGAKGRDRQDERGLDALVRYAGGFRVTSSWDARAFSRQARSGRVG
jgi:hypothetical protein